MPSQKIELGIAKMGKAPMLIQKEIGMKGPGQMDTGMAILDIFFLTETNLKVL
jgi:hypothetical protein